MTAWEAIARDKPEPDDAWLEIEPSVPPLPAYFRRGEGVGAAEFRVALAHLAAGVCVLTSRDTDGSDVGMTVTSIMSASLDPPLVVVAIDARASAYPAITRRGAWAVSFLDGSSSAIADAFARRQAARTRSPFEFAVMRPAERIPALVIANALVALECVTEDSLVVGDHVLLVGRVVAATPRDQGYDTVGVGIGPLIRYLREYGTFRA